jgi:uncharacterized protein (TIGR03067 family)
MRKEFLAIVIVGLLLAPAVPQDSKGDQAKIQGTWKVLVHEDGGRKKAPEEVQQLEVVITKDKIAITHKGRNRIETAAYKLDPTKKPGWIDLSTRDDQLRGIYELKGDDLKLCFNEKRGGERSTKFVSQANSPNDVLLVLKRQK